MADEWACDDCGYITSAEPDHNKCPGCGSKMTKIEGVDDMSKDDNYDEDDLATPMEDDDDLIWDDVKEEAEEEAHSKK